MKTLLTLLAVILLTSCSRTTYCYGDVKRAYREQGAKAPAAVIQNKKWKY